MAHAGGDPAQRVLAKPQGVLAVEAADVGPPAGVQVGVGCAGVPQPQGLDRPRVVLGQVLHLHADDRAAHDRQRPGMVPPAAAVSQPGVQAPPRRDLDVAVLVVVDAQPVVGVTPGGGVVAGEPPTVAAGPPDGAGRPLRRVGGEHPVGADPYQHLRAHPVKVHRQPDRVIAGVVHKQRRLRGRAQPAHQRGDLLGRGPPGVVAWRDADAVQRRRPGVGVPAQLGDPGVAPARHDRLARAVP